jgi:hypothetical protein
MTSTSTRRFGAAVAFAAVLGVVSVTGADSGPQETAAGNAIVPTLLKASDYLAGYVKALSSVVSEERYEQYLVRRGDRATAEMRISRTLLSDYLLVAVEGTGEWIPFRDVYEVDGVAIRDRNDRLLDLFVKAPPDAYKQALRIRSESSRYNIGSGMRDINVPTFAFQVLTAECRRRFSFKPRGRERVDAIDAVVVEFVETASPTIVVGAGDEDVPSRGRFWIDPADGRILRSLLETRPLGNVNTLEVRFRYEPKLGLLVPAEMIERRRGGGETLEGRAAYSNFRRFTIDTSIEIK